ncbi:MAG: epimerase [Phycisphaerae bacterium SM23_30]|nr:MAG: epimerase [Phycisphaerae bacterium SM23_30]
MKVLVTGAAGFIGSHLCEKILNRGDHVVGLDNFHDFYSPRIKRRNLRRPLAHPHFELIEGDVRDAPCLDAVLAESPFDMIAHLAALAGVRPSLNDPLGFADVNIRGAGVVLEAARKHHVKKFIYASSSSIYGNNIKVPFAETDPVDHPISPYAATKKAAELLCHTYHHLYGIDVNCLRYFTVYGPRQRPDLAIHKFARLMEAGKPIPVFGDGSMARDFTYINDIIQGTVAAMDRCAGYHIYNLGESQPYRLDHLIGELEKALGKKALVKRLPVPPGDVKQTYADISKARSELGYDPKIDLPEGLARFVAWLRKQT